MTVTATSFRGNFTEFSDVSLYSDPEVNFWLGLAPLMLNADRWAQTHDFGIQLFVAHNLSLQFDAHKAASSGQNPGKVVGAISSASVDKVSYSRDASAAMDPSNGHWNLSTYGLRLVRLMRFIGAGPVYVGTPNAAELSASSGFWPGVY